MVGTLIVLPDGAPRWSRDDMHTRGIIVAVSEPKHGRIAVTVEHRDGLQTRVYTAAEKIDEFVESQCLARTCAPIFQKVSEAS